VKVRAICFDLDNTLWDVWPVIMRAEQKMYDFLAERYPRVVASMTIEMMRAAREQTAAAHPQMRHDFTFLRKQTLREHAQEFGYAEAMVEEAFDAFIRARNEVDLYPDVLPALERWRRAIGCSPRATATPISAESASRISSSARLPRGTSARSSPIPRSFHKVIEGTDLQAHEVVYVGDDPLLDVEGARGAGMQAIWIDRQGGEWPPQIAPASYTVRSLTELVELL
jgi:putative hydrolase of the HAD superfamily